ncbi:MAG: hypothetical protein KH210_04380 [Roseburia sp.]|nr:hypothetical protein [Roseburia sp.]
MRVKGAKKRVAIALAAALVVSGIGYVPKADAESVTQVTGDYSQEVNEVCDTMEFVVSDPAFGSVGGEWAALVLGRAGRMTEEWKTKYLAAVKTSLDGMSETLKAQNKLHSRKLTENSRAIIGLYSAGADVTDFYGWNLCAPLAGDNVGGDKTEESQDYKDTIWQGINGPVYALIALDYAGYKSEGETKVTDVTEENTTTLRDDYLNDILSKEISGGGWALFGDSADPDITMMAVQALSKYTYLPEVNDAVERALTVMSSEQNAQGGYSSWGSVNAESISQVICGLTMLGIDPTTDERFIKNGNTLVDALKSFRADCVKDKVTYSEYRGYAHVANSDGTYSYNQMATEQAGYAMVALWCQKKGQKLYQNGFRDIPDTTPTVTPIATPEVTETPTTAPSEPAVPTVTPVQSENPDAGETAAPSAVPTMTPSAAPTTPASAVPTKAPATPVTPAPTAVATKIPTPTAVATKTPAPTAVATKMPTPTAVATKIPVIPTPATTTKPENPDIVPTATPKAPEPTKTPEATKAPEPTKTPETAKKPAVTKAPETIVISKIVKKAAVEKGKKITIKAIVNGKKVKCKVSSYNKKALKVTVKNGKLVIKAKKKAKAGKTYKVVIKYKKGKKTVKKTVKITVK